MNSECERKDNQNRRGRPQDENEKIMEHIRDNFTTHLLIEINKLKNEIQTMKKEINQLQHMIKKK